MCKLTWCARALAHTPVIMMRHIERQHPAPNRHICTAATSSQGSTFSVHTHQDPHRPKHRFDATIISQPFKVNGVAWTRCNAAATVCTCALLMHSLSPHSIVIKCNSPISTCERGMIQIEA